MSTFSIPHQAAETHCDDLGTQPEQQYTRIPQELRQSRRWLLWRRELRANKRGGMRQVKEPYSAWTSAMSSVTDYAAWASFERAYAVLERGGFDGLGFAFGAGDGLVFIDLDGCISASGEVSAFATWVLAQVPGYVEVSQSGHGLHLITRGTKPGTACSNKRLGLEMYSSLRFCALTGRVFAGRDTVADGASGVCAVYHAAWPQRQRTSARAARSTARPEASEASGASEARPAEPAHEPAHEPADEPDELVLQRAQREDGFEALWAGAWGGNYPSQSEADAALCLLLLRACGGNTERADALFRQSGLMREKWDEQRGTQTYGETTLDFALRGYQQQPQPSRKREDRRTHFSFDWQQRVETPEDRDEVLRQAAARAKERVQRHIAERAQHPLVVTLPPGSGKSYAVAMLGQEMDLAWVAERHAMVENVKALHDYRHIQPANTMTCPTHYRLHEALARVGRNTWPVHKEHVCQYGDQHRAEGSAVYQLEHVRTSYPLKHEGIVVDEMNLASWLRERRITREAIRRVRSHADYRRLTLDVKLHAKAVRLLEAVEDTLNLAKRESRVLWGKDLFDALNAACEGRLTRLVNTLKLDGTLMLARPTFGKDPDDPDALREALALPPVVLPFVLSALAEELPAWKRGGLWNSRIRIASSSAGGDTEWALHIVEPLRFPERADEPLPPRVLLDATANPDLLARLGWEQAEVAHEAVVPPPTMRHIAVRTGKRYGKGSMVNATHAARYREGVIREARYLLGHLDPDGAYRRAGQVGLITYDQCEAQVRTALGIAEGKSGHFWAQRGSNALEDCAILLVIGTPLPHLDTVLWWARMLWADDPAPILNLDDPRVQQLADYLSQAELTQCAHRNRPLRHAERVVVSMCVGDIADLPVTELVTELPQLRASGERHDAARTREVEEQLERAAESLVAQGVTPSVRKLQALVHVRVSVISGWLVTWKARRAAA